MRPTRKKGNDARRDAGRRHRPTGRGATRRLRSRRPTGPVTVGVTPYLQKPRRTPSNSLHRGLHLWSTPILTTRRDSSVSYSTTTFPRSHRRTRFRDPRYVTLHSSPRTVAPLGVLDPVLLYGFGPRPSSRITWKHLGTIRGPGTAAVPGW